MNGRQSKFTCPLCGGTKFKDAQVKGFKTCQKCRTNVPIPGSLSDRPEKGQKEAR